MYGFRKYSQVVAGNLFIAFGQSRFPDSKMDCKSSEEENYKNMKKFMTANFAKFNLVKKKITGT